MRGAELEEMIRTLREGLDVMSNDEIAEQLESASERVLAEAVDSDTLPAAFLWAESAKRLRRKTEASK